MIFQMEVKRWHFSFILLFNFNCRTVLLAEILKHLYPKLVEVHNYPPRNSMNLKLDNWLTLNRKVLKKIGHHKTNDFLLKLAAGAPGYIECLLYEIMCKITAQSATKVVNNNNSNNVNTNSGKCFSISFEQLEFY